MMLFFTLLYLTWELLEKLMKLNLATKIGKFCSAVETRQAGAIAGETIDRKINSFISVEKKRARFRFVRLMSRTDPGVQVCIQTGQRSIMQLGCLNSVVFSRKILRK